MTFTLKSVAARWLLAATLFFLPFFTSAFLFAQSPPAPPTPATGPLVPSSVNPNYFTDGSGKAIYLTGSHTWNDVQDWGTNGSILTLDFNAYVQMLVSHGQNFTLLWRTELPTFCNMPTTASNPPDMTVSAQPWLRTGPGTASDGQPKFDLTQFNQTYFDSLRARVQQLGASGVYAGVYLFTGEWLGSFRCSNDGYPLTGSNNINGIDDGGGTGSITMTAKNAITAIQDAYVEKTVDTLNDLPNVLWIVSEEAPSGTSWWTNHVIDNLRSYEATKPYQHPIGDANSDAVDSNADWIADFSQISGGGSACGNGTPRCKVQVNDSDHSYFGMWNDSAQTNRNYLWENFTNSTQVFFMDPYVVYYPRENRNLCVSPADGICSGSDSRWENFRNNLGYAREYAARMNLIGSTSQGNLSSTSFVLADTAPSVSEYLIYSPNGGSFSANLSGAMGNLNVEWLNPSTGAVTEQGSVAGGATRSFIPPFSGDAVLYLSLSQPDTQPPTRPTGLSVSTSTSRAALTWSPSTDNVGVSAYNIYRSAAQNFSPASSNRIAQSTLTSYADTSFTAAGTYYYYVTAQDAAGNISSPSNQASASIVLDQTPPSVSISSPSAGATVTGVVTITASATDNVSVASVQFLLDGAALGSPVTSSGPAYTFNWSSTASSNGTHVLSARATDGAGNTSLAANVSVTVSNTAPSGLVAAYSFNEGTGTTVFDSSGNNLSGTIVGATWTTAGKYGNALSFNGSSSYIDLGDPAALQLIGSMTLEAWVRAAANPSNDGEIIAKSSSPGWQLKTTPDTGPETFGLKVTGASSSAQRYSSITRSLNTWYHVAAVYNAATGAMDIYVNGVLSDGELNGAIPPSQDDQPVDVNIGRRTGGFYFNGIIDEVRIYNRALSQAEIQSDMNTPIASGGSSDTTSPTVAITAPAAGAALSGTVTVAASVSDNVGITGVQFLLDGANLGSEVTIASGSTYSYSWNTANATNGTHLLSAKTTDAAGNTATSANVSVTLSNSTEAPNSNSGLIAAYSFNAGSGTVAADDSGNGIAGTIHSATWTSAGKYGDGLSFNGSNAYVDLGNPAALGTTGSMTWTAWVMATGTPSDDGQIIAKSDGTTGWQLKTSPDTGPQTFGVKVASNSTSAQRYSNTVVALNTWYFVAGVYNATTQTLDIYVNGVLDDGVLNGTVPSAQAVPSTNASIGRRTGGFYFNGTIDEVRVYGAALTQEQIQQVMTQPLP
jgi:fibronectin type 3 domain-containing protein